MEIIGHERERAYLKKLAGREKMAQSYLFIGPSSVGKSLVALEFAAELSGYPGFTPTEERPHPPDVMIIRPEEVAKKEVIKQKKIPAEAMRQGLIFLSSFPSIGRYRVLIITQAELLSETAANVLLKTLEEPTATAVIILIASEEGRILPTLVSRTEKIRFSFVPEVVLGRAFAGKFSKGDDSLAHFFYSLGRPGLLVRSLENNTFFSDIKEPLSDLFRLSQKSIRERLALAERLALDVPRTTRLLEWWLPGLHAMVLQNLNETSSSRLFLYLEAAEETLRNLKGTQANPRLLLERLFLRLS